MPRAVAFLRAINVGGHTVTMADLRRHFAAGGFGAVDTFIASGNVLLDTGVRTRRATEQRIESMLKAALGYDVATFLRSGAELAALAAVETFSAESLTAAAALNVAFLHAAPAAGPVARLMALRNDVDDFHVQGREVYWLCRVKQSESKFSGAVLERTLGMPATIRGMNTVRRLLGVVGGQPHSAV